jgi:hypothetical protein
MRLVLILSGIAVMTMASGLRTAHAAPPSYGPLHGLLGLNSLEGPMRQQGSGYVEHMGLFSTQPHWAGGPGPMITGHIVGPAIHYPAHVVVRAEQSEVVTLQAPAPGGAGTAAAAPADSTAGLALPRPPGVAGPGRRVSGWSGPGLPGPGRVSSSFPPGSGP